MILRVSKKFKTHKETDLASGLDPSWKGWVGGGGEGVVVQCTMYNMANYIWEPNQCNQDSDRADQSDTSQSCPSDSLNWQPGHY